MAKIYNEIVIDMNPESPTFEETLYEDYEEYSGPMMLLAWENEGEGVWQEASNGNWIYYEVSDGKWTQRDYRRPDNPPDTSLIVTRHRTRALRSRLCYTFMTICCRALRV